MKYLQLPLIVLDVLVNVALCVIGGVLTIDLSMIDQSWLHTLSARAGHMQEKRQPYFAWVADAIDLVFGDGHCARQWMRERDAGSVWASWSAS